MVDFNSISKEEKRLFAKRLAKHLSIIKERTVSTGMILDYDEDVASIIRNNGMYCLQTVSRPPYTPLDVVYEYVDISFHDFELLWIYQNKLEQLDITIDSTTNTIVVNNIGSTVLESL